MDWNELLCSGSHSVLHAFLYHVTGSGKGPITCNVLEVATTQLLKSSWSLTSFLHVHHEHTSVNIMNLNVDIMTLPLNCSL